MKYLRATARHQCLGLLAYIGLMLFAALGLGSAQGQGLSISHTVDEIKAEAPSLQRTEAARQLFILTKGKGARRYTDADISALSSLLDEEDMSVEYWAAASLGNIGVRAAAAVPKLTALVERIACVHLDRSPADAARYALRRMKAKIPPKCNLEPAGWLAQH